MPHLQNCDHSSDGWCLACVKKLGDENLRMRVLLDLVANLRIEEQVFPTDDGMVVEKLMIKQEDVAEWLHVMEEIQLWSVPIVDVVEARSSKKNGKWLAELSCGHAIVLDCKLNRPSQTSQAYCPYCDKEKKETR